MGGFFGVASKHDAISDVFFGTDYHSHLGPKRGGMAAYDKEKGLQRDIHNIENSPFRTKFDKIFDDMMGNSAIGCISDTDPQPLLFRSGLGAYAITMVGAINNSEEFGKPVVCVMTAMKDSGIEERLKGLGAIHFFVKPLNLVEIADSVKQIISTL